MKSVNVINIEMGEALVPRLENQYAPFSPTYDVSSEDVPGRINQLMYREFKAGRSVVPIKVTIRISSIKDVVNIEDEVEGIARRALKSIEYLHAHDRGMIGSNERWVGSPYVHVITENPCKVLNAIKRGSSCDIKVIGFLTRAN